VRIAPPAKARTNATVFGEAESRMVKPTRAARPETTATSVQRPRIQRHAAFARRGVERLLDELERDCADQHAAAECHDQAERPLADAAVERERAAGDQRRGGEKAPRERGQHPGKHGCFRGRRGAGKMSL
jgi:hypothetical protein